MLGILSLIAPFFALIGLGYAVGRIRPRPVEGLEWLNTFIVYLALPALFFQLLSKTPVEELANIGFVAATTFATFLVFAGTFCLALATNGRNIAAATIKGLAGAYGNIGYMGPGLVIAALGPAAAVPVALILCCDSTLHFVSAPTLMAIARGEARGRRLVLGILGRIFGHPFIIATIVGIGAAAIGFRPPDFVDRTLQLLTNAAAPCALFAMGVTLALRPLKRIPPELGYIVPAKLVLHPLAVWLLLGLAGSFDPVWVQTAVLLACLPTATNVFVIAQQYGVWTERASAAILVTTLVSVATVTGALALFASGLVPVHPLAQ